MGNRLAALVSQPVRDFNIENRVEKVISAAKPRAAPRHPSDAKYEAETSLVDRSKVVEKQEDLVERLRNVKVVSSDPQNQERVAPPPAGSARALPQSRTTPQQRKYGFFEPSVVPRGRLTLRQATQMLSDAQTNPAKFTPQALAAQYDLSEKDVHSILKYFRVFNVVMPGDDDASRDLLGFDTAIAKLAPGKKQPTKPEEDAEKHKSANEGGRTPEDGKT